MARSNEFVADARRYSRMVWEGLAALKTLQREWNALDYGTTLPTEIDGILRAEVGAVVFATADAIEIVLAAGNATNMAKLL